MTTTKSTQAVQQRIDSTSLPFELDIEDFIQTAAERLRDLEAADPNAAAAVEAFLEKFTEEARCERERGHE